MKLDVGFLRKDIMRLNMVLPFLFIMIIMVGASITTYVQVNKLKESKLRENFRELQKQVMDIKLSSHEFILKDRNNVAYFASHKSQYIDNYRRAFGTYQQLYREIKILLKETGYGDTQELDALDKNVLEYNIIFKDIESRIRERGMDRYGIIGDFDVSLEAMSRYDYGSDNISLLRLRYFIREYQLNGSVHTVKQVSDETYLFSTLLEKYISDKQVVMVVYALSAYEENFKKLVAIDAAIGLYSGKGLQEKLFNKIDQIDSLLHLKKTDAQISQSYAGIVSKTMVGMVVATLLLGFSIVRFRERDLKNDKRLLEIKVLERTIEIQNKNIEINTQAEKIKSINQNLENIVQDRTSELERKNKALEEYAFITAHNLRAPVASILGLVSLTTHMKLQEEDQNILEHLRYSTQKLNSIVRSITEAIEEADEVR
jgi:hypothetical protein